MSAGAVCGCCEGSGEIAGCLSHRDACDHAQPDCDAALAICGACNGTGEVTFLRATLDELLGILGTLPLGEGERIAPKFRGVITSLEEEIEAQARKDAELERLRQRLSGIEAVARLNAERAA